MSRPELATGAPSPAPVAPCDLYGRVGLLDDLLDERYPGRSPAPATPEPTPAELDRRRHALVVAGGIPYRPEDDR